MTGEDMKSLLHAMSVRPLLSPAAICCLLLFMPLCLSAMGAEDDTTRLRMQKIVFADTTLIAAVTGEDDTRITVVTPAGEVHQLPKSAILSMTFAYEYSAPPPLPPPSRPELDPEMFPYDRNWRITLADGSHLTDVGLDRISGDSLVLMGSKGPITIHLRDLQGVYQDNGRHFWRGAGLGGAAGLLSFLTFLAVDSRQSSCLSCGDGAYIVPVVGSSVFITLGALIGGIIGAFIPDRTDVDFASMNVKEKSIALERIIGDDHR
jgi:hypothetical protein